MGTNIEAIPASTLALADRAHTNRTVDRLEVRMDALQYALRARPAPGRRALLLEDLRGTREEWDHIIDQAISAGAEE